ncbi:MAG: FAD-dependent oxidoreductase [Sneathiella sp.]|uniref:NAD(P)/FAD-dependent oxidoreductase n=1 Tax=Sneathiella sp. TaxID=1964365 RepID=UPI003001B791
MKKIAVIGSGIAGLSSAWLLSKSHDVTLFEKDDRLGGHSNTVTADSHDIDTGFIVYNTKNYPNLVAFFDHLGVATEPTEMSFSVSIDDGKMEYSGTSMKGLFAQKSNMVNPFFWQMLLDIRRFYKEAPKLLEKEIIQSLTLGEFLENGSYSKPFVENHLLPMGAAIWSTPANDMLNYPAAAFIRFCKNHGLLQVKDRPEWRTVTGGSRIYVDLIADILGDKVKLNTAVVAIHNENGGVLVEIRNGTVQRFDEVVVATHADQALSMISNPSQLQQKLLGSFPYERNLAVLHTDESLMPKRKRAWASWNYLNSRSEVQDKQQLSVTYWMNKLQNFISDKNFLVTLNPSQPLAPGSIIRSFPYEHPLFDSAAIAAQHMLWNLQGKNNLWFCGSYFGYGFHEDGIQSGLAVAEALGGRRRPWKFDPKLSRIALPEDWVDDKLTDVA